MQSENQPITPWGAFVMFWLLAATILGASIPMIAGIVITALIPWFGDPRPLTGWHILHFLWIYTVYWLIGLVSGAVFKHIFATGSARKIGDILDDAVCCLTLAVMYSMVFFRDTFGAVVAALLSLLLTKPFVGWLEKHTPPGKSDSVSTSYPEDAAPD